MRHSKRIFAALFCCSPFIAALFALGAAQAGEGPTSCIATTSLDRLRRCDANVRALAVRNDELFVLVGDGGGSAKLVAVRVGKPLGTAVVLIPARPGRMLVSVHAAKDAIYVLAREGKASLLRVPARMSGGVEVGFLDKYAFHCRNCRSFPALRTHRVMEVAVPSGGEIMEAVTNPDTRGITLTLDRPGGTVRQFYDPPSERWRTTSRN